jgi:hypothetical protein
MDCRRLEPVLLDDTLGGPELYSRLKPSPKVVLNVIRRDLANRSLAKRFLEVQGRAPVRFVSLRLELVVWNNSPEKNPSNPRIVVALLS